MLNRMRILTIVLGLIFATKLNAQIATDDATRAEVKRYQELRFSYGRYTDFIADFNALKVALGNPTSSSRVALPSTFELLMANAIWSDVHDEIASLPPCSDFVDMRAVLVKDTLSKVSYSLNPDLSLTISVDKAAGVGPDGNCLRRSTTLFAAWDVPSGGSLPGFILSKLK